MLTQIITAMKIKVGQIVSPVKQFNIAGISFQFLSSGLMILAFRFRLIPMGSLPQKSQKASWRILAKCPQNLAWLQLCKETCTRAMVWGKFSSERTPVLIFYAALLSTSTGLSLKTTKSIPPMLWWSPGLMSPPMDLRAEETAASRRWVSHSYSSNLKWMWSLTESIMFCFSEKHLPAGYCISGDHLIRYCPLSKGWDKVFLHACGRH